MLVLSRQKNQKVNFPGLGISVEILDIRGSKVRVGVDAPLEVRILRDEVPDYGDAQPAAEPRVVRLPQRLRHDLRNALHELGLMFHLYHERVERDGAPSAEDHISPQQMFEAIVQRVEQLGEHGVLSQRGVFHAEVEQPAGRDFGAALLVDDDDNERELLAGFLRMCDYRVDTASDGLAALDYLRENKPPRVIMLDMQMPRCNGVTFLRRVRSERAWDDIHVFVVSGHTPEEIGAQPSEGYTHWFDKPLNPRRVVNALSEVEAGAGVA